MSSFNLFLDHQSRFVRVTAFGELYQKEGEEIITNARMAAAEHQYGILYDIREVTSIIDFASWFKLPRELNVFRDPKTRNVRAAILTSPKDKAVQEYKFYETVTANLGIQIKVFFEEDEAVEWLKKSQSVK